MRNPSTIGYEGAANLLEGVRVAADPASRNKGALVVLNDEINSARNVTKSDALRLQTFRSREYGQLGVVDRDRVVFFSQIMQRHNEQIEFDISKVTELPRVDVIMVYQGASGDLIKAAVDNGAKGIVIAVAGAGATSGTQNEGLAYAASKGVFIVTSTRTGSGRIAPPQQRQGDGAPGVPDDARAAAPPPVHDRRRGSHADQGARAADGRAHEDHRSQRAAANLFRIPSDQVECLSTAPDRPDSTCSRTAAIRRALRPERLPGGCGRRRGPCR